MEKALNAVDRGAELTKRLLAFSRKQTLEPKVINVNELVENMKDLFVRSVGESIVLHFDFSNNI